MSNEKLDQGQVVISADSQSHPYVVDWDKVQTIEDIKNVLEAMNIVFFGDADGNLHPIHSSVEPYIIPQKSSAPVGTTDES